MNKVKLGKLTVFFILSCSLLFGVVFGEEQNSNSNLELGWKDEIQVSGSGEDWQSKLMDWGWEKGIGDFVDFYVPGRKNPSSSTLRITDKGNVGIGIANPKMPLDVRFSGDSGLLVKSIDSHSSIYIDSGKGAGQYIRFMNNGKHNFWIQATKDRLNFRPNAQRTPSFVLYDSGDIIQNGKNFVIKGDGIKDYSQIVIENNKNSKNEVKKWAVQTYGKDGTFRINEDATTKKSHFVIEEGGNIGIGITNPKHKLEIAGDVYIRGQDIIFSHASEKHGGENNIDSISYNDDNKNISSLGGGGIFTFLADSKIRTEWENPSASISVMSAYFKNKIGIGTVNPSEKLEVAGNIKGEKLYINEICDVNGENCKKFSEVDLSVNNLSLISNETSINLSKELDENFSVNYNSSEINLTFENKTETSSEGTVKLGYQKDCNIDYEGSQRYNKKLKKMEFCNGEDWKSFHNKIETNSSSEEEKYLIDEKGNICLGKCD
jgi:hypothetical protein